VLIDDTWSADEDEPSAATSEKTINIAHIANISPLVRLMDIP